MAPTTPAVAAADPELVLPTLRRFDGEIEEVLATSGHVSLYTMAVETQQWNRKNVEGSLFVLKRRSAPRYQMLVLNKLATENYTEDIHSGLDFELNPPYLMYTHGNHEIIGVWFYEQEDLHRIEDVLKSIKQSVQSAGASPVAPARAAPQHAPEPDDSAFYDKPAPKGQVPQRELIAAAPPAPAPTDAGANLVNLLRNAQLKQQQQQAAAAPQLLPPSFFQQQAAAQRPQQPQQPQVHDKLAALVGAARPPAPVAHGGNEAMGRVMQQLERMELQQPQQPALAAAPAPPPENALAKLFANAHKVSPLPPKPHAAQQPQQPPAPALPHHHHHHANAGVSDEEKVRRLLGRIATNEALLKMLAGEMRAVGLL